MLNRVLILSASSGNGHIRCAQAIEKAFVETGAAAEVKHADALQYTSPMFRALYANTYIQMVNRAPHVLGYIYDAADKPWRGEHRRLAFDRLNALPLVRLIRKYEPDVVVCTHFMPAEIVSWLIGKGRINTRQAIVVTDFDVHAMWLTRNYDRYFTAMEETREHLHKMGIPSDKIAVTGIPIDPVFSVAKDKREMRDKYKLSQDKNIVMLSAGGFGVGKVEEMLKHLTELQHPTQILAMCGRNEKVAKDVKELAASIQDNERIDIIPVSFTDKMDEYMAASDIIVGKPGGLTTCEALARGLVMVVVNPIPGQEERNSDHLLEEGAAIRCNNLPALAYKIDKLLDDPAKFTSMRKNALKLGKPRAAYDVVEQVDAMMKHVRPAV